MPNQLWLRLGRDRITERGYGLTHKPGDVVDRLTGAFAIEPASGFACAPPDYSLSEPLDWVLQFGNLVEVAPFAGAPIDGLPSWPACWSHREAGELEFTTVDLPAGAGCVLRFITYDGGKPFELLRGPARVVIEDGRLTLFLEGRQAASTQMWEAEEWHYQPHYLALYAVGRRVVARRLGPTSRWITGWLPLPEEGETGAPAPVLPVGPVTLKGDGYLTFGLWPERHETTLDFESQDIALPEPSTTGTIGLTTHLAPAGTTGPTIAVTSFDADGAEASGETERTAIQYRVTATLASAEGPNVYVTRVRVKLPRKVENDGQEGVNLLAAPVMPPAAGWLRLPKVEERRSLDPESCGISFDVAGDTGALSPYVQPNMLGQWRVGAGETPALRAEFFTSRPQRTPHVGYEALTFECELGWKRLREAKWPGEFTVAGMTLSDAYQRVAEVAGLDDEQMVIAAGTDYQLPRERADGEPLFDFRPGQTIAEILGYLRDHFSLRDILRFCPDGKFHADPRPQAASGVKFWLTAVDPEDPEALRAFLLAGGQDPTRPYLYRDTWHERFDEQGFANEVEVVGMADDGTPLVAVATDWPSIRDPQTQIGVDEDEEPIYQPTFNYVGEFRRMVIVDAGLTTQALVNWVCRRTLARVRLLRLVADVKGSFVPGLLEGDIVEVDGRGLWRVTALKTEWTRDFPAGQATYEFEAWNEAVG